MAGIHAFQRKLTSSNGKPFLKFNIVCSGGIVGNKKENNFPNGLFSALIFLFPKKVGKKSWKEYKEEKEPPPVATTEADVKIEGTAPSQVKGRLPKADGIVEEQDERLGETLSPYHLWLYAGILLGIYASSISYGGN
jgi:hypothetical protein